MVCYCFQTLTEISMERFRGRRMPESENARILVSKRKSCIFLRNYLVRIMTKYGKCGGRGKILKVQSFETPC